MATVGYMCEGALYCPAHTIVETGAVENGHIVPFEADHEWAADGCCTVCGARFAPEKEARMLYLDITRITGRKTTAVPRTRQRPDGYGSKLPSACMLQLDGKRWHRVYTVCWSNAGTSYVVDRGVPHYLMTGFRFDD